MDDCVDVMNSREEEQVSVTVSDNESMEDGREVRGGGREVGEGGQEVRVGRREVREGGREVREDGEEAREQPRPGREEAREDVNMSDSGDSFEEDENLNISAGSSALIMPERKRKDPAPCWKYAERVVACNHEENWQF